MNYKGTIIEESLTTKAVFDLVKILSVKVEQVTLKHKTPWLKQWTLDYVEIPEEQSQQVAELLSKDIEFEHESSWYADYRNESTHYIIFKNKIFKIDRSNKQQYEEAYRFGLTLGIPDYQLITFESQKKKKD